MRKRIFSILLAVSMVITSGGFDGLGGVQTAQAAEADQTAQKGTDSASSGETSSGGTEPTKSELSEDTYKELGLKLDTDAGAEGENPYGNATVNMNPISELSISFSNGSDSMSQTFSSVYMDGVSKRNSSTNGTVVSATSLVEQSQSSLFGKLYHFTENEKKVTHAVTTAYATGEGKDNHLAKLSILNRKTLQLSLYAYDSKGKESYVNSCVVNSDVSSLFQRNRYQFELSGMLDIRAFDMDGDGYDEIACYDMAADKVRIYSVKNNYFSEIASISVPDALKTVGNIKKATVSLSAGDLDQDTDHTEELVVVMNQSTLGGQKLEGVTTSRLCVYRNENGALKEMPILADAEAKNTVTGYDAAEVANGSAKGKMVYAAADVGDVDNDSCPELVYGGRFMKNNGDAHNDKAVLAVLQYNHDKKYLEFLQEETVTDADSGSNQYASKKDERYFYGETKGGNKILPPVALVCAATSGTGCAETIFIDGALLLYSETQQKFSGEEGVDWDEQTEWNSNDTNHSGKDKNEMWFDQVIVGNFDGNAYGQEQILYTYVIKRENTNDHYYEYWMDAGYLKNNNPGSTKAEGTASYQEALQQMISKQPGKTYNSKGFKKSKGEGLYCSLAAIDYDDDGILCKFKTKDVSYSEPEVLTVLQSAPYFEEISQTGYDYPNNGSTGYGASKGSSTEKSVSASVSVGGTVGFEQGISVLGVEIAKVEYETETEYAFSYEYASEKEVTVSESREQDAGTDAVIVYTVPYVNYYYDSWIPETTVPEGDAFEKWLEEAYTGSEDIDAYVDMTKTEKAKFKAQLKEEGVEPGAVLKGHWDEMVVSLPKEPGTTLMDVDTYDKIASRTKGMTVIRGKILENEAGSPETYGDVLSSFERIGNRQLVGHSTGGVNSVSQEVSESSSHSFSTEVSSKTSAKVSGGGLGIGVSAGFGMGAGVVKTSFSGTECSGTVDCLPTDRTDYDFAWEFGLSRAEVNGAEIPVLQYRVSDVTAPMKQPKNFMTYSADKESMTVIWDKVSGASAYELYALDKSQSLVNAEYTLVDTVSGHKTSYTYEDLLTGCKYSFGIRAVGNGEQVSEMTTLEDSTMPANALYVTLKTDLPEETSVKLGEALTMTCDAYYDWNGATAANKSRKYIWQKYNEEDGAWKTVGITTDGTYTIDEVTAQMEGDIYRCKVSFSYGTIYVYSAVTTLVLAPLQSTITMSMDGDRDGTATATTVKKGCDVVTQQVTENVTETVGEQTYQKGTMLDADGAAQTVYEKDGTYYQKSGGTMQALKLTEGDGTQKLSCSGTVIAEDDFTDLAESAYLSLTMGDTCKADSEDDTLKDADITEISLTAKMTSADVTVYKGTAKVSDTADSTEDDEDADAMEIYAVYEDGVYTLTTRVETDSSYYTYDSGEETLQLEPETFVNTTKTTTQKVEQETYSSFEGDTITLTAKVTIDGSVSGDNRGGVSFIAKNETTNEEYTYAANVDQDGNATYAWMPEAEGKYTISAVYSGVEAEYNTPKLDVLGSSTTDTITLNVGVCAVNFYLMQDSDADLNENYYDDLSDDQLSAGVKKENLYAVRYAGYQQKMDFPEVDTRENQYINYLVRQTKDGKESWEYIQADSYRFTEDTDVLITISQKPYKKDGVYQIYTADQLVWFHNSMNKKDENYASDAELKNDIDMKGVEWEIKDGVQNAYVGTFDGNGYAIKNLAPEKYGYGLFNYIGNGGVIKNLVLKDAQITGSAGSAYHTMFVHRNKGTIQNCIVDGGQWDAADLANKKSSGKTMNYTAAALVQENYGKVQNCIVRNVTADLKNASNISFAMMTGACYENGSVQGCLSYGNQVKNAGSADAYQNKISFMSLGDGDYGCNMICSFKMEDYTPARSQDTAISVSDLKMSTLKESWLHGTMVSYDESKRISGYYTLADSMYYFSGHSVSYYNNQMTYDDMGSVLNSSTETAKKIAGYFKSLAYDWTWWISKINDAYEETDDIPYVYGVDLSSVYKEEISTGEYRGCKKHYKATEAFPKLWYEYKTDEERKNAKIVRLEYQYDTNLRTATDSDDSSQVVTTSGKSYVTNDKNATEFDYIYALLVNATDTVNYSDLCSYHCTNTSIEMDQLQIDDETVSESYRADQLTGKSLKVVRGVLEYSEDADAYEISDGNQLMAYAVATNAYAETYGKKNVRLTQDIDMSAFCDFPGIGSARYDHTLEMEKSGTSYSNQQRIYTYMQNYGYSGTFDGNGKTIRGLNLNGTSFIGCVCGGTVKNLTLKVAGYTNERARDLNDSVTNYTNTIDYIYNSNPDGKGALVRRCAGGTIDHVTVTADESLLENGSQKQKEPLGLHAGIAGVISDGTVISNCSNALDLSGSDSKGAGGIVYRIFAQPTLSSIDENDVTQIKNCINTGRIASDMSNGGIVSVIDRVSMFNNATGSGSSTDAAVAITSCINHGSIQANASGNAGGLAGTCRANTMTVTDSANLGMFETNVSGTGNVGGLIGYAGTPYTVKYMAAENTDMTQNVTLTGCYNAADISMNPASGRANGGLIGFCDNQDPLTSDSVNDALLRLSLQKCYNTGAVGTDSEADADTAGNNGGILGEASYGGVSMTDCYTSGNLYGTKINMLFHDAAAENTSAPASEITNTYGLAAYEEHKNTGEASFAREEYLDGTAAYLLESASENTAYFYGQKLDADQSPVFVNTQDTGDVSARTLYKLAYKKNKTQLFAQYGNAGTVVKLADIGAAKYADIVKTLDEVPADSMVVWLDADGEIRAANGTEKYTFGSSEAEMRYKVITTFDRTTLETAVKKAENIMNGSDWTDGYTEDTKEALEKAYKAAKVYYDSAVMDESVQEEVNQAATALEEACGTMERCYHVSAVYGGEGEGTVTVVDSEGNIVTEEDSIEEGTELTATLHVSGQEMNLFDNWYDGATRLKGAGKPIYTFTVTDSVELVAMMAGAPTVHPVYEGGTLYEGGALPQLSLSKGDTEGTVSLDAGQTLSAQQKEYTWTFTPKDIGEYVTWTGTITLDVQKVEAIRLTAAVRKQDGETLSDKTADALKENMTVYAEYNDGSSKTLEADEYTLEKSFVSANGQKALMVLEVSYQQLQTSIMLEADKKVGTIVAEAVAYLKYVGDKDFSLDYTADGDGEVTCEVTGSRDADGNAVAKDAVVTVSKDGKVTITGEGTAQITVHMAEGKENLAAEDVTITVIVQKKDAPAKETEMPATQAPKDTTVPATQAPESSAAPAAQTPEGSSAPASPTPQAPEDAASGAGKTVQKGQKFTSGKYCFAIKDVAGKEAEITGVTDKKMTSLKIPAAVKYQNTTYRVTSVKNKAFRGCTKLKSATIGKNVTAIGKNAFNGCKSLKTIRISSSVLEKVGKNAIRGIHKKAMIKVPSAQWKAYRKLFQSSTGFKSTMKIKKQ